VIALGVEEGPRDKGEERMWNKVKKFVGQNSRRECGIWRPSTVVRYSHKGLLFLQRWRQGQ
jgi:hypothetical protein